MLGHVICSNLLLFNKKKIYVSAYRQNRCDTFHVNQVRSSTNHFIKENFHLALNSSLQKFKPGVQIFASPQWLPWSFRFTYSLSVTKKTNQCSFFPRFFKKPAVRLSHYLLLFFILKYPSSSSSNPFLSRPRAQRCSHITWLANPSSETVFRGW